MTPEQQARLDAVRARSKEFPDETIGFVNNVMRPAIEQEDWFELASACKYLSEIIAGWGEGAVAMTLLDGLGKEPS